MELAPPPEMVERSHVKYDPARLERFDNVRHDAVHDNGDKLDGYPLEEERQYLFMLEYILLFHVAIVVGVKLTSQQIIGMCDSP